jgi:hypothetical protein
MRRERRVQHRENATLASGACRRYALQYVSVRAAQSVRAQAIR